MPDLCGENGVCIDTSGNYTCGCLEGYEREGHLCASELFQDSYYMSDYRLRCAHTDNDECTMMPDLCGENGVCTDTSGSYTCGCLEGYEREGELCTSELFQDLCWTTN